jgi:hypothetical protein
MTVPEVALPLPRRFRAGLPLGRRSRGRTLEALLVVLILGVVIHEALQGYRAITAKTYVLNAISLSTDEHVEAITVIAATGVPPDRVVEGPTGRALSGAQPVFGPAEWQDGELVFPASERVLRLLGGDVRAAAVAFRMARAPVSGATVWLCGSESAPPGFVAAPSRHTTIDARYLPHFCRSAPQP